MDEKQYRENAEKIIELAQGMTQAQWSRISHLIVSVIEQKKASTSFEKPRDLDLLMKQHFIV